MKKALALVLALVLALSMAVSAFAVEPVFVTLKDQTPAAAKPVKIPVVDAFAKDIVFYTTPSIDVEEVKVDLETVYYVALPFDKDFKNIKLTANGNITAELVAFDPAKMVLDYNEADPLTYSVYDPAGMALTKGVSYADALKLEKAQEKELEVNLTVVCDQYVNIIKITVANNFSAHYTEGTLKVEATLYNKETKKDVPYAGVVKVINDVVIFEYEQVKWAAENIKKGAALQIFDGGYSDYVTAQEGYSVNGEYDYNKLREQRGALVVSTTAFRAVEGKDLTVAICPAIENVLGTKRDAEISVTLKEIAAGQKGVNFFAFAEIEGVSVEIEDNEVVDYDRYPSAVSFGFLGDQIVKGKFEITVDLPINYYELRELFGLKVEEEDIINYYVVDEDNNVVKTIRVDYMTDDISDEVEFVIEGENEKLGWYTLCLEVPAVETEGEANPNTGAESVVGVVAALAVVSVATAAAVSLKK